MVENAGILNYSVFRGDEILSSIQAQRDRQFFRNTVAIFNQLEDKAVVVQ